MCTNCRLNNTAKEDNFGNNIPGYIVFRLLEGGKNSKCNGVGFVEISEPFASHDAFLFEIDSNDSI